MAKDIYEKFNIPQNFSDDYLKWVKQAKMAPLTRVRVDLELSYCPFCGSKLEKKVEVKDTQLSLDFERQSLSHGSSFQTFPGDCDCEGDDGEIGISF